MLGLNDNGQLGDGTTTNRWIPVQAKGAIENKVMVQVVTGTSHTCALGEDRVVYCWGYNGSGQLGTGNTINQTSPVATSAVAVVQISAQQNTTCAVTNSVFCWGDGTNGQMGNATNTPTTLVPTQIVSGVLSGKTIQSIDIGSTHVCAVSSSTSSNGVYCWGRNDNGQLGNGTTSGATLNSPVAVVMTGVLNGKGLNASLSLGWQHSCVMANAQAYCWGLDIEGQLGNDATLASSSVPVAITGLAGKTVYAMHTADQSTCMLVDTQQYCTGFNGYGTYANGTTTGSGTPMVATSPLLNGKASTLMGGGNYRTCTSDYYQVFCTSESSSGQLGNGKDPTSYPAGYTTTAVLVHLQTPLTNTAYRFYQNADSTTPGTPLTPTNTSTQLPSKQAFRLRTDIKANDPLLPSDNTFKLQFAQKNTTACSTTTGFADITTTSAIAWNTNPSTAHNTAIATTATDPTPIATTTPQTYQSAAGPFTTTDIPAGNSALWDFSLKDNTAPANTTYCFRIVYGDGTDFTAAAQGSGTYTVYPELTTAGDLDVSIVDSTGTVVSNPTFPFSSTIVKTSCQTTTGVFGITDQRIRVTNPRATNGWSLSIAATAGPTALWTGGTTAKAYDYNEPGGCIDNGVGDPDNAGGQLSVDPSTATITPQSGATTTGISKGTSSSFTEGLNSNSINLMTGSSSNIGAYWELTGASLSQLIAAGAPADTYSLGMTVTVVAN